VTCTTATPQSKTGRWAFVVVGGGLRPDLFKAAQSPRGELTALRPCAGTEPEAARDLALPCEFGYACAPIGHRRSATLDATATAMYRRADNVNQ